MKKYLSKLQLVFSGFFQLSEDETMIEISGVLNDIEIDNIMKFKKENNLLIFFSPHDKALFLHEKSKSIDI